MEEQKKKALESNQEAAPQKLSYEQLNEACAQLSQQNHYLGIQLQQAQANLMSKRLDYLFTVLNYKDLFDSDFVIECTDEIKEALQIKEDNNGEQQ